MALAALNTLPLVSALISSARRIVEGDSSALIAVQLASEVAPYRDTVLNVPIGHLFEIVRGPSVDSLTTAQLAAAVREASQGLHPYVGTREKEYLNRINERLRDLAGPVQTALSSSGIFVRHPADMAVESVEKQWTEDRVILVGGAFHDAANTLVPIEKEFIRLRKIARELCGMEVHFAEVAPIGSDPDRRGFVEALLSPAEEVVRRCDGAVNALKLATFEINDARHNDVLLQAMAQRLFEKEGILPRAGAELKALADLVITARSELETIDRQRKGEIQALPEIAVKYDSLRDEAFSILDASRRFFDRAAGIIETVLEVNEAGSRFSAFDLQDDLNIDQIQVAMGRKVSVSLEIAPGVHRVAADSRQVWRILINLMANARRAMQEAGSFSVSVFTATLSLRETMALRHQAMPLPPRTGNFIVLEARDSGPGISSEIMKKIFQPFYSHENSTGYGLAVVLKALEDMGGFIGADSSTDESNSWTAFTVYLPAG